MLSTDQRSDYAEQGFLVLPGFKRPHETAALARRAHELVEAFDPAQGASRFSTRDRSLVADERLLASAEAMHCF
ncbi:MAG: phytanoyl-CoA dioxygenase family protein, partial [Betaproteobacteria bacterium]